MERPDTPVLLGVGGVLPCPASEKQGDKKIIGV
jgi:hypothetical protein